MTSKKIGPFPLDTIQCVDALGGLRQLPNECIDCVAGSPPYWGLRDYGGATTTIWDGDPNCDHDFRESVIRSRSKLGSGGKAFATGDRMGAGSYVTTSMSCTKCGAWRGQLGMEPDVDLYVKHLADIFDEVKRVLKPTGTVWINIGDSYGGSSGTVRYAAKRKGDSSILPSNLNHLPAMGHVRGRWDKCLMAVPERFMLEMLNRGWILRNKVIWHKPNPLPCSVKDRLANTWEFLFFFVKSKKYHFDLDAIRIPHKTKPRYPVFKPAKRRKAPGLKGNRLPPRDAEVGAYHLRGKNPGDVTSCDSGGDFLKIATKPGFKLPGASAGTHFAVFPDTLIERPIQSGCPPPPEAGIVLDPFMGSGTTAIVARRLGRHFLGLEMNPDYVRLAEHRLDQDKAKADRREAA